MDQQDRLPPGVKTAIEFNTYEVPAELGIAMPPQAAACVLGITEEQFLAHVTSLSAEVNRDARQLAAEAHVAEAIDRLPVPRRGLVMSIGDSVTTYRRSYAELLRALLALRRPSDEIRFVNHAQSGYASTHARRSAYLHYIHEQPDLVLILLGGNDCERFGGPEASTLVSVDEYRRNMEAIIRAFRDNTSARLILLTPVPVVESMLRRVADFAKTQAAWRNADLQNCADALQSLALQYELPLVNLMNVLGEPSPALYFPDGLHPGPDGQRIILKQLLQTVTEPGHGFAQTLRERISADEFLKSVRVDP